MTEGLVIAKLHRSLSHNKHYHIYEGVPMLVRKTPLKCVLVATCPRDV